MIDASFDTNFKLQLKAAQRQLAAFRSGDQYVRIAESYEKRLSLYHRLVKKQRNEMGNLRRMITHVRNIWFDAMDAMERDYLKKIRQLEKEKKAESNRAWKAESERDTQKAETDKWRRNYYETAAELEEEKGRNLKLKAQLNRDYENSSIPSSKSINRKKIPNSREKTGRKPGAQPGHPEHRRAKQQPTQKIKLPTPKIVCTDPTFKKTRRTITKQLIRIRMILETIEYSADVYYNSETGERAHGVFPEGVVNDVNYIY